MSAKKAKEPGAMIRIGPDAKDVTIEGCRFEWWPDGLRVGPILKTRTTTNVVKEEFA